MMRRVVWGRTRSVRGRSSPGDLGVTTWGEVTGGRRGPVGARSPSCDRWLVSVTRGFGHAGLRSRRFWFSVTAGGGAGLLGGGRPLRAPAVSLSMIG